MSEQTSFVGPKRAAEKMTRARAIPGVAERSAQARANGQYFDLRWVLLHMIEETARHAGHADLLREAVDGAVGE